MAWFQLKKIKINLNLFLKLHCLLKHSAHKSKNQEKEIIEILSIKIWGKELSKQWDSKIM